MSAPRLLLLATLAVLAPACGTEAAPAPGPTADPPAAATLASDLRLHHEPVTRLRFPVLAAGARVDVRHHDPTLPLHKFRHSIRVSTDAGVAILIDVWDNPGRVDLRSWFDAHLAFLIDESTRMSERPVSRAAVPGIVLAQPASPQARSQAIAVLAPGEQVVRITAIDPEGDPVARRLFDEGVAGLETGVVP